MNTVFDIEGEVENPDLVLCEWGENYCSIAGFNAQSKTLHRLRYFSFENAATKNDIDVLLDYVKSISSANSKVVFCAAFPEAVLVPKKLYKPELVFLQELYGTNSMMLADHIGEWQLVNSYSFPPVILQAIRQNFSSATYYHVHTPALKIYNGFDEAAQITVHFTPSVFRVVVKKAGQVMLVQMYRYKTALDAVYYLLKIMEELDMPKVETAVIVSGLVEESSGLYKELHQFIQNLQFAKPSHISIKSDLPPHYFTSLYNLAACVS
ncbi:MAG: hypothetical protein JWP88_1439 [Flaviaesturariibacter sp.]|nr:hypothetical protein [Flaviaesturariibacter sp.]